MKCSICNNEFGNGDTCAHCGTDRVSGLGDYVGYKPSGNKSMHACGQMNYDSSDGFSICWKCEQIIPKDAKFCPYCSTALVVSCPKCGKNYSSQYPSCPQCGTNRENFLEQKRREEIRKRQEEDAIERGRQLALVEENNRRFEEERKRSFIEAENRKSIANRELKLEENRLEEIQKEKKEEDNRPQQNEKIRRQDSFGNWILLTIITWFILLLPSAGIVRAIFPVGTVTVSELIIADILISAIIAKLLPFKIF